MSNQPSNSEPYTELIKKMMIDYVVHDFTHKQLMDKYNLTARAVTSVCSDHKFREKRLTYQEKVLNKSLEKMATRQAFIVSRITNILWKQVERIEAQQKNNDKLIDSNRMKEVLTSFALLSKEYRLDTGKSTDNQTHTVSVVFGSDVPIISENHLNHKPPIEVETVTMPAYENVATVVNEEDDGADIEDGVSIFGGLDG